MRVAMADMLRLRGKRGTHKEMLLPDIGGSTTTLLALLPPYDPRLPPLGLASLAEYLRGKGRDVALLDLNNRLFHGEGLNLWEPSLNPDYWQRQLEEGELGRQLDALAAEVAASSVKVVGLLTTLDNSVVVADLARRLREACDEIYVVAGGPGTEDGHARRVMADDGVDYFVVGEGEISMQALLTPLLQGVDAPSIDGVIPSPSRAQFRFKEREPADLATLCLPVYEDFDLDDYIMPGWDRRLALQTTRGCDHLCAFCVDRRPEQGLRAFPPGLVAARLEELFRRHRLDQVELNDLMLNGKPEALQQWCEALAARELRLFWTGQIVPHEGLTMELLRAMRLAGCIGVRVGVESGSDHVLGLMGRAHDSRLASRTLHHCREAGLHTEINLMVGFPGEREEDFQQTLRFVETHLSCINKVDVISTCEIQGGCALELDVERFGVVAGHGSTDFTDELGATSQERDRRAVELALHLFDQGARLGMVMDEAFRQGRPNPEVEAARADADHARLKDHSVVVDDLCVTMDDSGRNVSINYGEVPLSASPGLGTTLVLDGRVVDMTDGRWSAWTTDDGVVHLESALLFAPVRLHLFLSPLDDGGVKLRLNLEVEKAVQLERVRLGLMLAGLLGRYVVSAGDGPLEVGEENELPLVSAPVRALLLAAADEQSGTPHLALTITDGFFWDLRLARDPRGRRLLLDRPLGKEGSGLSLEPGPHLLAEICVGLQSHEQVPEAVSSREPLGETGSDFALVFCPPWQVATPPLWTATLAGALRQAGLQGTCHDVNTATFRGVPPEEHHRWDRSHWNLWRSPTGFEEGWAAVSEPMGEAIRRILSQDPAVVAFSTTEANLRCSLRMAQMIKEAAPRTRVVFGGPGVFWIQTIEGEPSLLNLSDPWTGEHLDPTEAVDVYLRGEADESLPALIKELLAGHDPLEVPGAVAFRAGRWAAPLPPRWPEDLDALALPDYSDLDVDWYSWGFLPLSLGRGCSIGCAVCSECRLQYPHRTRSPERIMEEVTTLHEAHEVRGLVLADPVFNADPEQVSALCELLAQSDLCLPWTGHCHPGALSSERLVQMAAAGCGELILSLDSLSQSVVDAMRKGFDVDQTLNLMSEARELGIQTTVFLLVGYPRETPELFEETLAVLAERGPAAIGRIRSITSCHMTPGSRLWDSPDRYGIDASAEHRWYNWTGPFNNTRAERLLRVATLRDAAQELGIEVESWEEELEDPELLALIPSH